MRTAHSSTTKTFCVAATLWVGCVAPAPDNSFGFEGSGTESVTATGGSGEASDGSSGNVSMSSTSATTASTTVSTTVDPDTGVDECGPGAHCGDPAANSWFGPVIIARAEGGAALPDCPAEYPEAGPTMLEGYNDPGPAICDCTCELNAAQTCTSYTYSYAENTCYTYQNFLQFSMDCHDFTIGGGTYFYMYQANQPFCQQMKTEEFPEPVWDATIRSCRLPDDSVACGTDGACQPDAPEGFEPGLCIYKEGDAPCPDGQYSEKLSYWAGVDDQRDCSNCTCGQAVASCSGSMHVFDAIGCGGNQVADVPNNFTCVGATGQSVGLNFTGESNCPIQTMPEAMGTIAPAGNFTFCCQPG